MNKKILLEQANSLLKAAKDNPEQFQELAKKYEGFKAVENSAKASGARNPAAVAAAAGREKYGKKAFDAAAASGKKMNKTFDGMDIAAAEKNPQAAAEARIKISDDKTHEANWAKYKGKKSGEKSSDYTTAALKAKIEKEEMTDNNPVGGIHKSEQNKEIVMAADKGMSKEEILKAAKGLIELAKTEPAKFAELTKAMAAPAPAPAAPMAKPAAPKMPAAAPAMMKPKAPGAGGMRMSKDEIKADLAKPWEPKHKKMGAC